MNNYLSDKLAKKRIQNNAYARTSISWLTKSLIRAYFELHKSTLSYLIKIVKSLVNLFSTHRSVSFYVFCSSYCKIITIWRGLFWHFFLHIFLLYWPWLIIDIFWGRLVIILWMVLFEVFVDWFWQKDFWGIFVMLINQVWTWSLSLRWILRTWCTVYILWH